MKHLYFVRHGLSVMNKKGLWSGRTDTPLTDEGKAQCHAAGKQLQDVGIDLIIASPITRALATARIIAEEIGIDPADIVTHDAFVERDFGPLEGTTYSTRADLDNTSGVEHSDILVDRVREGLTYLQTLDAETILVVSHGAVGRALRVLLEPETTFHTSQKFGNAEVVQLL